MKDRPHYPKANFLPLTADYLERRATASIAKGYTKQKWIEFCETLLAEGYHLKLYEAKNTVSKYVHVQRGGKRFKVRFSNHKSAAHRENAGDCDYYVGVGHKGTTTTAMALEAVRKHFGVTA